MILFGAAAVIVIAFVVMGLWNWLIPSLFAGPIISFWQAVGLMLLTRILLRGFTGMQGGRFRRCGDWKEKFEKMTPEQKEKMRDLWKKRCGGFECKEESMDEKSTQ